VICAVPDVVVLSEYVPSALATQLPVTSRDPVTGMDLQPRPNPDTSRSPVTSRHDDATVHVPTTSPPQAATSEHEPPPLPGFVTVPVAPPLIKVPSVSDGLSERRVHAPAIIPNAMARTADWVVIERLPSKRGLLSR
jgi:hypothetical protein